MIRHTNWRLLLLTVIVCPVAHGGLDCQNGATLDVLRYECICTAFYHGNLCENSFVTSDPCAGWLDVSVLDDRRAAHRLGNSELCQDSQNHPCIDFSVIEASWYRVVSPAGNHMVSQCPSGNIDCGSQSPYILVGEVAEDNPNRILSKARAYRYRVNDSPRCYMPEDTSYPVRILKCSAALTLYYLQPLPTTSNHYCIGDKKRCGPGLTSIDGTGFEPCIGAQCLPSLVDNPVAPAIRLDYHLQPNRIYKASFYCNVFSVLETKRTDADGVKYLIEFELTYRNGTSVTIPRCRWSEVTIGAGQNRTFECRSEQVLTSESNVYGGSLICRVQARCNTVGAQYNSMQISSSSHGFFFTYWFNGGTDVIKPGQPVSLCISSKNIPVFGEVTFRISVGRQQIMLNDKIDIAVVRRDGNESLSCGFKMISDKLEEKRICQDMTLYNHDPENHVLLGLEKADQISVIKVNITYTSTADGLYTKFTNGTSFLQPIQNIHLKVDLTSLQTNVTTYLHAYTDPWIKTADSAYARETTFFIDSSGLPEQTYLLIKHRLLPYEIQGKVQGDFFTDISIRYVYNVIHIYGSSTSGRLNYAGIPKQLPGGAKNQLKIKPDGLPFGVTLDTSRNGLVIKVRFDLYGTILYIWGFHTNRDNSVCSRNFVMSSENLHVNNVGCSAGIRPVSDRFALDVMLVPGFYDTPNRVDGLIFGNNRLPFSDPKDILLSPLYQMKLIQASNSRMQPTEVLSICSCHEDETKMLSHNCFVDFTNKGRGRRETKTLEPPLRLTPTASSSRLQPQLFTRKISEQEADEFCNKFVDLQLSKSVSTEICSATKDPTGQADYISQFKLICAQYAATLGTYQFSQSLFNSMLGMCYTDMTFNATVVLGNSTQIEMLQESICPANCSERGSCMNGECNCNAGFWGTGCELEIAERDQMPVEISLLQQDIFCPSDNCSAAYLLVKPFLKSADCVCHILVNSRLNYTVPSVPISGDIVMCELKEQHKWLVNEVRMYAPLEIQLTAETWESNNTVELLLHQSKCEGRPVSCNEKTMSCDVAPASPPGASTEGFRSAGNNYCLPAQPDSAVSTVPSSPLVFACVLSFSWLLGRVLAAAGFN